MNEVSKEKEILNYHFKEIFNRFEFKLDILESELAEFLNQKTLISRIIYDFLNAIITGNPSSLDLLIQFIKSKEIILIFLYILFGIITLYISNRKVAKSDIKDWKRLLKISQYLAGFRVFILFISSLDKIFKLSPDLKKEISYQEQKNNFIEQIYEKMKKINHQD